MFLKNKKIIVDKNIYEIKFNDADSKESVIVIQSYFEKNFNKNLFKITSHKGDISKIKNNILEENIDNIIEDIRSQGLEIISVIILNWRLQDN